MRGLVHMAICWEARKRNQQGRFVSQNEEGEPSSIAYIVSWVAYQFVEEESLSIRCSGRGVEVDSCPPLLILACKNPQRLYAGLWLKVRVMI